MTKLLSCFGAILLILAAVVAETSWGRGFGGMHGGMRGGGIRGGGFGGMRPGVGNFGGGRPGGANFGGSRAGGSFGGDRPGELSRGEGFSGNREPNLGRSGPGQIRPGSFGASNANRPDFAASGAGRFPGGVAGGFGGNTRGAETAGGLRGPRSSEVRPTSGQVGSFLGLPSDGGLHTAAGATRVGRDQRGLARYPDADLRRRGDYVRRNFRGRDYYSADWYRRYPGAWYPRSYAYGNVWAAATWDSMNDWFGYGNPEPTYYDYGNNVTYQNNSVYMNGQDMGTSDQYYQQAQTLANTGAQAKTTDDQQWMPLGVFAMTHNQQTKANLILQLAVNKQGMIRGNYTATLTNDTKPVHGSVDKGTQKSAWTIGDNKGNVIETGIYNLTKDQAPALVHFGRDKTEQWLLVRVKQDEQAKPQGSQN